MNENLQHNEELLTRAERARLQKQEEVCAQYERLHRENPDAPVHRIMNVVAERMGMSLSGVRNILIDRGLFTPSTDKKN